MEQYVLQTTSPTSTYIPPMKYNAAIRKISETTGKLDLWLLAQSHQLVAMKQKYQQVGRIFAL